MLPSFIGIGAAKAGTTWLFKCLQEHPQIYMAPVKETNFFDYADDIDHRLDEYEEHFRGARRQIAIGEISVRYLDSKWGAAGRIRRHLPNVRLFVSLRNPIDQVYSHYWHLRRQNFHQDDLSNIPRTVEAALETQRDKLMRPALYHAHLQRWLSRFERNQLLVLLYDDISTHPQNVLKQLYEFLGVFPDFAPRAMNERGSAVRRGTSPRFDSLERIRLYTFAGVNRHVYSPLKSVIGVRRAARLKDTLRAREAMELMFMRKGYPPMAQATRSWLRRELSTEFDKLSELIGRDLSGWQ